ncbi:MAG: hypothetical protein U1F61_09310 [Opitutaceae bacterium]
MSFAQFGWNLGGGLNVAGVVVCHSGRACCSCYGLALVCHQYFTALNAKVTLSFEKGGVLAYSLNDGSELEYWGSWTRSGSYVVCSIQGDVVVFKLIQTPDRKMSLRLGDGAGLEVLNREEFDSVYIQIDP